MAPTEPRMKWAGLSARHLPSVDSTMDAAWEDVEAGAPHGHMVTTDHQTGGRGSHGRGWVSGEGQLALSIVLRLELAPADRAPLTLALGLAVADALAAESRSAPRIKWPNDVLIENGKVAGILVESRAAGVFVAGIGINLYPDDRVREAGGICLADVSKNDYWNRGSNNTQLGDVNTLVVGLELLSAIETRVDAHVEEGAVHTANELEHRLAWKHEQVRCGNVEGILVGVAPSGALRIRDSDQVHEIVAGRLERI